MSLEHPDYRNLSDRALYEELFYYKPKDRQLTEQETQFVNWMYHMEESLSGLD